MSEKERDWIDEEKVLIAIYIKRGYSGVAAMDMAQREIAKRKIEYKEVIEKAKSKLVKSLKKGGEEIMTWAWLLLRNGETLHCDNCDTLIDGAVYISINEKVRGDMRVATKVLCGECRKNQEEHTSKNLNND